MGFQLSPGVNVSEIDLTGIVPSVATTDVGFCGVFRWGPLNEIVLLSDESQLVQKFGKPDDDTAVSFFTAANVLAYSDKIRLVRVADTTFAEHTKAGASAYTSVGTALSGSGFLAELKIGSTLVRASDSETRTVIAITDDTHATLDAAFSPNLDPATDSVTVSTYVGARNATAAGPGLLIKNNDDFDSNYSNGIVNDGAISYGEFAARHPGALGNSLTVSVCPSKDAFKRTVDLSADPNSAVLTGEHLDEKLSIGTILKYNGVTRKVVSVDSATQVTINASLSANALVAAHVEAKWQFADAIGVAPGTSEFAELKGGSSDELHVVVVDRIGTFTGVKNAILERFSFLSKASDAKSLDGAAKYYVTVINNTSKYIRVLDHPETVTNWGSPALGVSFNAPATEFTRDVAHGEDVNDSDHIDAARIVGYDLFANGETVDVSFLCCGDASTEIALAVIAICESRKDCIALISPPKAAIINNPGYEVEDSITFRHTLPSTSYAVMDSGWKYQYDKYNDAFRWVPLNGDIAGVCVRTDVERDPWWSPAGLTRGQIKNCVRLAYSPFKAQRDDLYVAGINTVTSEKGQGPVLFGDKTLLDKPSAFDRINVRRLFIVLEKAIAKASKYMLFEFNDEATRTEFKNLVIPYLSDVQGRRGVYDFRVICDSTNNTPEVIDSNQFIGDIYIKPTRSINIIQLNFVAVRTGVEFSEIVGSF